MQLFQINQSEDSSKITIMFDNPSGQFHQRSITSAFNYNRTYSNSHPLSGKMGITDGVWMWISIEMDILALNGAGPHNSIFSNSSLHENTQN